MAGRRGKTGITIAGVFGGVAIILITIIVIIQTGAWALVAPANCCQGRIRCGRRTSDSG